MANRFWVGGTGTWNASNTTNWSATSGGAGGASVPTTSDAITFDANSGGGTVTLAANGSCSIITFAGYTGTVDFAGYKITCAGSGGTVFAAGSTATFTGTPLVEFTYSGSTGTRTISCGTAEANTPSFNITAGSDTISGPARSKNLNYTGFSGSAGATSPVVYGNLTLSSTMTMGTASLWQMGGTLADSTITSNGRTFNSDIYISASGRTVTLVDDFATGTTKLFNLSAGTFDAAGKNVTIGTFSMSSPAKTLTLGSGTWTVGGATWNANTNSSNLTVSASTGKIVMTSGSAKTFSGGGKTWPTLDQGGAGALTIAQSNTFADITSSITSTSAATITFTAGTTQTVTQFTASGSSGKLLTLQSSSAGNTFSLQDNSGVNNVVYCSIKDSVAIGPAKWQAYLTNGNINAGNNVGWVFTKKGARTFIRLRRWIV